MICKPYRIRKRHGKWQAQRRQWAMGGGFYYAHLKSCDSQPDALHIIEEEMRQG